MLGFFLLNCQILCENYSQHLHFCVKERVKFCCLFSIPKWPLGTSKCEKWEQQQCDKIQNNFWSHHERSSWRGDGIVELFLKKKKCSSHFALAVRVGERPDVSIMTKAIDQRVIKSYNLNLFQNLKIFPGQSRFFLKQLMFLKFFLKRSLPIRRRIPVPVGNDARSLKRAVYNLFQFLWHNNWNLFFRKEKKSLTTLFKQTPFWR